MFSKIKSLSSKLHKYRSRMSSEKWLNYLRQSGASIGEGTVIHANPAFVQIDTTRPWLIEIGKNVQITNGVKILTHGFDWSVTKAVYGEIYGSSGKVKIGDNCFIGMNAIILKGSAIGDNVIIGAGSVVCGGEFPSNCVIAGNPARVICSLSDYRKKRINAQLDEAKELVIEYYKTYGHKPPKHILSEFFWLFEERTELNNDAFKSQMAVMNNYDYSFSKFLESKPQFKGYDEFLAYCLPDESL